MVPSARVVSFAAVLLALTVGARASRAGDDVGSDPPGAARVVLRGKTELGDALRAAIRARGTSPASVAIVVDVTPYVSAAEDRIAQAVLQVAKGLPEVTSWRAGALGRRLSAAASSTDGASLHVAEAMLTRTTVTNTVAPLRESLADFADRDAVVVYLADWRFEDDDGTEALVAALRAREQTLSVVGSEAAFSRAWNDGLDWNSAVQSPGLVGDPRIGRNPFGPRDADAPWHGGDAAWPGHPGYWSGAPWMSDFMPRGGARAGAIEDLRERLADQAAGVQASRPHALPGGVHADAAGAHAGRVGRCAGPVHGEVTNRNGPRRGVRRGP